MCNACHLRWKIRGRPKEGYSSNVFPPPHYDPTSRKRSKPQQTKNKPKKQKLKKTATTSITTTKTTKLIPKPVQDQENASPPLTVGLGPCTNCKTATTPLWRKGPSGNRT